MVASGGSGWSVWSSARGPELGVVVACFSEGDVCGVVVSKPRLLSSISQHSAKWEMTEEAELAVWHMQDVVLSAAWQYERGEIIAIML